jgi:hypothetical protein
MRATTMPNDFAAVRWFGTQQLPRAATSAKGRSGQRDHDGKTVAAEPTTPDPGAAGKANAGL